VSPFFTTYSIVLCGAGWASSGIVAGDTTGFSPALGGIVSFMPTNSFDGSLMVFILDRESTVMSYFLAIE